MDAKRLLLITALSCVSALAHAQDDAGRSPRSTATIDSSAPTGTVTVQLDGAVERPGNIKIPAADANVRNVLAAGGGATPDSYRLATLLLRRSGAGGDEPTCIPLAARHAGLLLQDDPRLGKDTEAIRQLMSGQRVRIDASDSVAAEPGARPVMLQDGDFLAIPARSGSVYVATGAGRIVRMPHLPSAPADEYVDQLPKEDRRGVSRFVLHYPNGRQFALSLGAWRYRPTAVPPGSLIAPESVCLRSE
ncbi:MAG TPA: hypothetical protein VGE51_01125 [Fontimonas sp.]